MNIDWILDAIVRKNAACNRVAKFNYSDNDRIVILGATDNGYATWKVAPHDMSSYHGHYFTVTEADRRDHGPLEARDRAWDEAVTDFLDRVRGE